MSEKILEEERRAKIILETLFPKYSSLEKSERPDWIDTACSLGVEVTLATDFNVNKNTDHIQKKLINKNIETVSEKSQERLAESGLHLVTKQKNDKKKIGEIIGAVRIYKEAEHELIFNAMQSKYPKMYPNLECFVLYIVAYSIFPQTFGKADRKNVFDKAQEFEKQYEFRFNQIIIDFYGTLLVFDIQTETIQEFEYDPTIITNQS